MIYSILSKAGSSTAYLTFNDMLVDLSRSDVVLTGKGNVQITFVVSQIQIDFPSVIEHKYFSMPIAESLALFIPGVPRRKTRTETHSVGAIVPASTFM